MLNLDSKGLVEVLCKACEQLKWNEPSKIQKEAIPVALQGKDVIGLAETGSGKTAAFALPILQALLENPQRYFALILTPTRELAFQISEQFEALGEIQIFLLKMCSYYFLYICRKWNWCKMCSNRRRYGYDVTSAGFGQKAAHLNRYTRSSFGPPGKYKRVQFESIEISCDG